MHFPTCNLPKGIFPGGKFPNVQLPKSVVAAALAPPPIAAFAASEDLTYPLRSQSKMKIILIYLFTMIE